MYCVLCALSMVILELGRGERYSYVVVYRARTGRFLPGMSIDTLDMPCSKADQLRAEKQTSCKKKQAATNLDLPRYQPAVARTVVIDRHNCPMQPASCIDPCSRRRELCPASYSLAYLYSPGTWSTRFGQRRWAATVSYSGTADGLLIFYVQRAGAKYCPRRWYLTAPMLAVLVAAARTPIGSVPKLVASQLRRRRVLGLPGALRPRVLAAQWPCWLCTCLGMLRHGTTEPPPHHHHPHAFEPSLSRPSKIARSHPIPLSRARTVQETLILAHILITDDAT